MQEISGIKESTVKDFLEVIFRRKWIILGIVLLSTAIVIAMNLREPAAFESSGRMLVKRGEITGVFNNYVRTLSWEEEIASQIEMVKSQVVIERAQEILPKYLPEGFEPGEKLSYGKVGSGVVSTSNVLWVTYTSGDPIFCEAAVNSIVNSYKEYYQQVRTPPEMEDFFSAELNRIKEDLEYWRQRKAKLSTEWGIVDLSLQRRIMLSRLDDYRDDLNEVRLDRENIDGIIEKMENFRSLDIDSQATLSNSFIDAQTNDTRLNSYNSRLVSLRIEESELAVNYTDDHLELKKVRNQIEDLYTLIEKEIEANLTVMKTKRSILMSKEESIMANINSLKIEQNALPEKEIELDRAARAIDRLEKTYNELAEQQMDSRVAVASNPEWSVTILAPASPAYQKKTRDYVRMALGPFFSLVIALGFAFFIDNLDHSIKNVSEAEDALGLQVLSSFPDLERK